MSKLVLVGRVAGAFGVRGELRITPYTADPLALARYRDLSREDGSPALRIESARSAGDAIIARATAVASKEAADALKGLRLFVPRDVLPDTSDEDEFYLTDLIGLQARTSEGGMLGVIKAVHDFGAGDILEVDPASGQPSFMVSFTRDHVPEVRLADGYVVVLAPPADEETLREGGPQRLR